MQRGDNILEHLNERCDRLTMRLGRPPSFLPVGRQEVKDLAQQQLTVKDVDTGWEKAEERYDYMMTSFSGILPRDTVWTISGIRLKQI